jgi:uncharacterized protein with NRDE domain
LFPDEQVRKQISGESNRFVTDEEYAQYKYQGSIFMRYFHSSRNIEPLKFIRHPTRNYGTRTHSVLLVSNNNEVTFLEKTLVLENRIADVVVSTESGQFWTTKKEIFKIK